MTNPDFQTKSFIFLERLWLFAAILSVLCVIYFVIVKDNSSAVFFIALFLLAGLQYLMRNRQKKRHLAYLKNKEEEELKKQA